MCHIPEKKKRFGMIQNENPDLLEKFKPIINVYSRLTPSSCL